MYLKISQSSARKKKNLNHATGGIVLHSCIISISIPVQPGVVSYPQIDSKHSSIESRWALVREHPFESLYTVCNNESMREAWCSVPAKRGAHLVNRGKTAVQRYRFRAKAISVALKAAYELNGRKIRFVSSMLLQTKRTCLFFFCNSYKEGNVQNTQMRI